MYFVVKIFQTKYANMAAQFQKMSREFVNIQPSLIGIKSQFFIFQFVLQSKPLKQKQYLKSSYSAFCTQFRELHSSLVSNDTNPIPNSNISLSQSSMVNGSKPFTLSNTLKAQHCVKTPLNERICLLNQRAIAMPLIVMKNSLGVMFDQTCAQYGGIKKNGPIMRSLSLCNTQMCRSSMRSDLARIKFPFLFTIKRSSCFVRVRFGPWRSAFKG